MGLLHCNILCLLFIAVVSNLAQAQHFTSTTINVEDSDATIAPPVLHRLENLELKLNALENLQQSPRPSLWRPVNPTLTFTGLGPVASKIYFQDTVAPVWGLATDFFSFVDRRGFDTSTGADAVNRLNVTSLAPALAVRLHARVLFNAQFLFENGGSESSNTVTLQKGQAVVLQAYVDWLSSEKKQFGVRIGHQLIPIGQANTSQEAFTYLGVLKPELEREIIPSTWHENGISLWARRQNGEVQLGVFNSLNAQGFRGPTFLAGGREHGQNASAQDLMGTARVQLRWNFAEVGASIAGGPSAQKNIAYRHGTFGIGELHVKLKPVPEIELFIQGVQGRVMDSDSISVVNSTVMGEKARGISTHLAVEVWRKNEQKLWAFGRYSHYDLHDQVPVGFARDDSLNKTQTTVGLSYLPLPNWVIKADYAFKSSSARDEDDEVSLGTGLSF